MFFPFNVIINSLSINDYAELLREFPHYAATVQVKYTILPRLGSRREGPHSHTYDHSCDSTSSLLDHGGSLCKCCTLQVAVSLLDVQLNVSMQSELIAEGRSLVSIG